MNFQGSRLGFWFKAPLGLPDRAESTNRVLVFYDEYTSVTANGTTYHDWYQIDLNPTNDVWPILQARLLENGFQPELIVGYQNLPADLTVYAHLWDIGYVSPYATNPISDPSSLLLSYIQAGGAMFMLGENASLNQDPSIDRDNTISTFLYQLGAGSVTESTSDTGGFVTCTIEPEFLISNNTNTVTFNRPGTFTSVGTGTYMTSPFSVGEYVAVMWETGSLSNAPTGAIISVLDINFVTIYGPQTQFIDNIIASLNQR